MGKRQRAESPRHDARVPEWIGLSALGLFCVTNPGALPQAGMEAGLWPFSCREERMVYAAPRMREARLEIIGLQIRPPHCFGLTVMRSSKVAMQNEQWRNEASCFVNILFPLVRSWRLRGIFKHISSQRKIFTPSTGFQGYIKIIVGTSSGTHCNLVRINSRGCLD